MGGAANLISGIQQGIKAIGGVFEAIGQFVPQFKQIGDMFKQASSAFDVMAKMGEKAASEEGGKDAALSAATKPATAPAKPNPLAESGFSSLQQVQEASGKVNGVLDLLKGGNTDPSAILKALGK
ncbi:MAG: hypothetical protein VKO64_10950 [Candidatus Sericytochromatia bacterium]|nr:hypothetical protein [Candidatus Sericytochromatia bacterium]